MTRRLRATGWSSNYVRVVGERAAESDELDARPAKTEVYHRKWFTVPPGPWPCEICSEYLKPGTSALRMIVSGEAFYRHPACRAIVSPPLIAGGRAALGARPAATGHVTDFPGIGT